ncbi:hypothetical protein BC628DRAFT_952477 [Trametes gibbosa]|nr:hypothetical protein BC628DRAFT_952477 [Trametes gibbosa]
MLLYTSQLHLGMPLASPTPKTRRRRPFLTLQAKKTAAGKQSETREDRMFKQMIPAHAFEGFGDGRVIFRKGDDVVLHSSHDETDDVWVGRILHIRTTQEYKETVVEVQWYWSRNDIAKCARNFDPSQCAPFERLLSDHRNYVSPYSFEGPRDFFIRARYQHHRRIIKPQLGAQTCFCQQAYNPFPTPAPSTTTDAGGGIELIPGPPDTPDVMHFCPSSKCRTWYHRSCLLTKRHGHAALPAEAPSPKEASVDTLPAQTRGLRLLAVSPDDEVLFTTFEYFYEPESHEEHTLTDTIVAHLPPGLCTVAQSPIIRYPHGRREFATGNVSDVVLARRFVYDAVQHRGCASDSPRFGALVARVLAAETEQERRLYTGTKSADEDYVYVGFLEELCVQLEEFGMLASPRKAYWEEKSRLYAEMGEVLAGPAFLCPKCRGAI